MISINKVFILKIGFEDGIITPIAAFLDEDLLNDYIKRHPMYNNNAYITEELKVFGWTETYDLDQMMCQSSRD